MIVVLKRKQYLGYLNRLSRKVKKEQNKLTINLITNNSSMALALLLLLLKDHGNTITTIMRVLRIGNVKWRD